MDLHSVRLKLGWDCSYEVGIDEPDGIANEAGPKR